MFCLRLYELRPVHVHPVVEREVGEEALKRVERVADQREEEGVRTEELTIYKAVNIEKGTSIN